MPWEPHFLPLSGRFPFYYEIKMAFVIWLLSPYTRGASLLYRKFVHPTLSRKEKVKAAWFWWGGGFSCTLRGAQPTEKDPGLLALGWRCPGTLVLCPPSTAAVVSAGDRHVHHPGQGAQLRDGGAFRQEGPQPGSHGCGPGGCQGTGNGVGCSASLRMLRSQGSREEIATPAWVASVVWVSGEGSLGAEPCPVGLHCSLGAWPHVQVPQCFGVCPVGLTSILSVSCPPPQTPQSQGALAGRLRSFSMQDLRSVPDETPVHYQDPLYLEEQENRSQLLGELGWGGIAVVGGSSEARGGAVLEAVVCPSLSPAYSMPLAGRQYESETEDEDIWSDSQVSPQPSPRGRDSKPLSRSQSLRAAKKKIPGKEVPWRGTWWRGAGARGT